MCGRYTYKLSWKQIVELYRITQPDKEPEGLIPSYNVAPTHLMPIIRPAGNGRELLRKLAQKCPPCVPGTTSGPVLTINALIYIYTFLIRGPGGSALQGRAMRSPS